MGRLEWKRVLVTGAATGIGRATAIRVASEGARVAMFDIKDSDADETLATITDSGSDARYWHVDVTAEGQVSGAVDEAADWLGGGIDVLTHLAGVQIGSGLDITDVDDAVWDTVVDINLKGSFIVVKHVARHMKAQRGGVIVLDLLGSGSAGPKLLVPLRRQQGRDPRTCDDAAGPSVEVRHQGQRHAPGGLDTPLKVGAAEELLRNTGDRKTYEATMASLSSPDGVAAVIAFLASDDASYVRGSIRTI